MRQPFHLFPKDPVCLCILDIRAVYIGIVRIDRHHFLSIRHINELVPDWIVSSNSPFVFSVWAFRVSSQNVWVTSVRRILSCSRNCQQTGYKHSCNSDHHNIFRICIFIHYPFSSRVLCTRRKFVRTHRFLPDSESFFRPGSRTGLQPDCKHLFDPPQLRRSRSGWHRIVPTFP